MKFIASAAAFAALQQRKLFISDRQKVKSMKKSKGIIVILLIVAILTLSVASAVLADDSNEGKVRASGPGIAAARVQTAMMHKMVKADENFKVRPLAEDKIKQMEDRFERLKENETKIEDDFKEKQGRFNETLLRLQACNAAANATTNATINATTNATAAKECPKIRSEAVARSKEAALKQIDLILNHLERLKQKLESSQNLPQDELNERIAKIDALIIEVNKIKAKIQAATTKSQINAALKELKQEVAKIKRASDTHSQGLFRAEIWGVLQRTEVIQKKLDCALSGLKANGTDTTALDQKLAQLNTTITQAKEKLKTAKDLLGSGNSTQIEQAKTLIREARGLVQQAHDMLQDIRKMIHDLGGKPCQEKQEIEVDEPAPPPTNITAPPTNITTNVTNPSLNETNSTNSTNNGTSQ